MKYEQAVIGAVNDVFTAMTSLEVAAGAPVRNSMEVMPSNISGSIGFAGDVSGALVVLCPVKTATAITADLLGMEVEDLGDDVRDAVGELVNMVAGGFKSSLARDGILLNISIPITVIGKGFRVSGPSRSQRIIFPFACEQYEFWIDLYYR